MEETANAPTPEMSDTTSLAEPASPSTTPVAQQLNMHIKLHTNLGDRLSSLEERLKAVLRPVENDMGKNDADSGKLPIQSLLADGLAESNSKLRSYLRRIESILDRLEV